MILDYFEFYYLDDVKSEAWKPQLEHSLMAEKGEVLERFCAFTTSKLKESKSFAITQFTSTVLDYMAEKITCDFKAIESHWEHNRLKLTRPEPYILRLGGQVLRSSP